MRDNILKEVLKNKGGFLSITTLGFLYLCVMFAPFFAPYPFDEDDVLYSYAPPTKIHFFDLKQAKPCPVYNPQ